MATYAVEIENLDQIRNAFSRAPELTIKALDRAIQKSAFTIEDTSKRNTPVRTGYLRASHTTTFAPLQGVISPTADYAIYVHEGTRFMAARPFLADAVQSDEDQVQQYFTEEIQNVLDEIAKESG